MTPETRHAAHTSGWNGEDGRHWVQHQDRLDAMLATLTPHLLDAARIKTADRVLDIGCGCGQTTRITADRAAEGEVLGVDISAPMLTEARLRAEREGLAGPASAGWNRIASVRNR